MVVRSVVSRLVVFGALTVLTGPIAPGQSPTDTALGLFSNMRYADALPIFENAVKAEPANAELRAQLAETYRRMGRTGEAVRTAREALAINECSSFAHCVLAQASPGNVDTVYAHVRRAVECDSSDPNGWLMMWGEAIRRNDPALHDRSIRKLIATGFFTEAALAYGRAELRNLPPEAILFTNGDMDTYPALAVQIGEKFRKDVTVIEREHLGIDWARRFLREHGNVPMPLSEEQLQLLRDSTDASGITTAAATRVFRLMIKQKEAGLLQRPIALAPTVSNDFPGPEINRFRYHGMFYLWEPHGGAPDTAALRACLSGIDPESFAGPWTGPGDRSPVRRFYTKNIAGVVSGIAVAYGEELIKARRFREAEGALRWAETFERKTEMGYVSGEEIARLRKSMTTPAGASPDSIGALFGNHTGTMVIYDRRADRFVVHNEERSRKRFAPFSTFKIPNSIIALETGVIRDVDERFDFDTTAYPAQAWWPEPWRNQHTMRSALEFSVVPFYRTIAVRVGDSKMKQYVDRFDYGNRDISCGLDQFWLEGCLKISAREQINFLRRFYEGKLGVSEKSTQGVKEILLREKKDGYRLSAKTGGGSSGGEGDRALGWYVGYVERGENVWFFAMNIDGVDFRDIQDARIRITRAVLKSLGIIG